MLQVQILNPQVQRKEDGGYQASLSYLGTEELVLVAYLHEESHVLCPILLLIWYLLD